MSTKLVLLGTGTPNAESFATGPSSAIIVNDKAYLIDFKAVLSYKPVKPIMML